MKQVLVFRTSVARYAQVDELTPVLNGLVTSPGKWNFDLEDCDNILRIETSGLSCTDVMASLQARGYSCEELPD